MTGAPQKGITASVLSRRDRRGGGLLVAALLCLLAGLALAGGLSALRRPAAPMKPPAPPPVTRTVAPPLPAPPDPAILSDLSPDDARIANAAVPLAFDTVTPAPAFRFTGSAEDRAAAEGCLAAAVLYEAGDDPPGERAVAQVVLNRLRHPAFPKTVCGVVFQGSERTTGCQFTFTCDGALARRPGLPAWQRAQAIAAKALDGAVYKPVGTATHYHADYVVPYWRDSLAKLAVVGPHIFYRWPGRWGEGDALRGRLAAGEPLPREIALLAGIAPTLPTDAMAADAALAYTTRGDATPRTALAIDGVPRTALKGSIVRLVDPGAGQYVLQLDPKVFAGGWAIVGYTICGAKPDCLVLGWTTEGAVPRSLPVMPAAMRGLAFMYRKNSLAGTAQPFWDCRRFERPDPKQCLPGTGG